MEAVEALLKENFQPERTMYIAFGHDEEVSVKKVLALHSNIVDRYPYHRFLAKEEQRRWPSTSNKKESSWNTLLMKVEAILSIQ